MNYNTRIRKKLLLILLVLITFNAWCQRITLEDIWIKPTFTVESAQGFNAMNDGLSYSEMTEEGGISKFLIKDGKKVADLVNAKDVKYKDRTLDISNYSFAPNEDKILVSEGAEGIYRHSWKANFYVFDIKTKNTIPVCEEGKIMFPAFSPDGTKIAFVRENNLYIKNLVDMKETKVTSDGSFNKIKNGWGDWVYEEEFSKAEYFCWSDNSQFLAYVKFDESRVKEYTLDYYKGELYPVQYTYKYPKVGEDNSIVTCHVFDHASGNTVNVDIGKETDIYIPRLQFTNDNNVLSVQRLNRLQNKFELLFVDAKNGSSKVIYSDSAKTYIDITDDLTFVGNKGFIISSERDEYNHLYHYDLNGKLVKQVTSGPWDVITFKGYDDKTNTLFYVSTENGPINRDVYSVQLDGKNKKRLSANVGFNDAEFTTGFKYYFSSWSDANTPPVYELRDAQGKLVKLLADNNQAKEKLKSYNLGKKEFFKVKNSEGTELNGFMIKPANFDATKKYPVYMYAYNGPGANECNNNWEGSEYIWHQLLAQEGYIVVCVDGRGTLGRGRQFKHCTYLQLGKYETADQIDVAKWLGQQSYVDKARIGFQGWSYGGYMACLMITKGAEYIKAAVAVAPVTNWKYYDNIYTERFMRTPKVNKEGYEENSPVNHAKKIKGAFLLIHGAADDNVHQQNSMEMIKAMVNYNIPFDMMIYPNRNHGIHGGFTRYHLYNKILKFVKANL
jgi:dipeptidyl-peptidase 4